MQKPKICFVCQNIYQLLTQNGHLMNMGGAELQQLLMAKEFVRRGYEVSFITQKHGQKEIKENIPFKLLYTFTIDEGIPVLRFFYPRLFKIWKALCYSDADIYYVRGGGFILAVVVFFTKLYNKKVIFCGADDTDFDPKKVQLSLLRDKILFWGGLKRCDRVVVQNKTQQALLLKNFKKHGEIIYNGFPRTNQAFNSKDEILWVAILRKKKNPEAFIELAKRFPNKKFVMIAGPAANKPDSYKAYYQSIVEKAKDVPNLEFKGFLPFEETEKYFIRAKLLVNTSEHEGFPNTFLQAWSRGIPVISFVNPNGLISKNNLGVVVKNSEEMAQTLLEVLNYEIRFSFPQIKAFFEKNLTIEKTVDKYETLFNHLFQR